LTDIDAVFHSFLLSLLAGLGTGVGGMIAVLRKPGKRSFGCLMGITAGVMITLSFLELVNEAWKLQGYLTATLGFAAGASFMLVIDVLVPHIRFGEVETTEKEKTVQQNPNVGTFFGRHRHRHSYHAPRVIDQRLFQSGVLLALGITIHNIPEGIAVGAGYMHMPEYGVFIAMAILLHNIPEGIATALPLRTSGMRRRDALKVSFLSGLAEPIGALAAAFFLSSFESLIPAALAFAGGVMMFITLDELIPTAREHGHQHYTAVGIILGAIFIFLLSGLFGV
jgi:zinc transporter, ZIP family